MPSLIDATIGAALACGSHLEISTSRVVCLLVTVAVSSWRTIWAQDDKVNGTTATQAAPAPESPKPATVVYSRANTCQPLNKTRFELNPPSDETWNAIKSVQALYENNTGIFPNLTCAEELRESGTVMSPNFPCINQKYELCAWILFAGDAPASTIAGLNPDDGSTNSRRQISLRFVSFDVDSTFDTLLVFSTFPPNYETPYRTLSGRLSPNYTVVVNNENASLVFSSSQFTGGSGFLIDFTTIINDGKPVTTEPGGIKTVVYVMAIVAIGSAILLLFVFIRRHYESRGQARKRAERVVAYTTQPDTAAQMNVTLPHDSLSYKDGLVFGGSKRPDVLLLYCEDDRAHCAAVGAFAALLRSLGGCDVRTITNEDPSLQNQRRDVRSSAIGSHELQQAALRADRIVLFLSRGVELVEQAFLCGKVYPRLYRDSEIYLTVPQAISLCSACSAVRVKTIIAAYDFNQGHPIDRSFDGNECEVVNSIGGSSLFLSSTVVGQLGGEVPVFRVMADMPRLIVALHNTPSIAVSSSSSTRSSANALEQRLRVKSPIVWSCADEYEASSERRQLIACLAAVEQSEMQGERGNKLFGEAYGQPADCWERISEDAARLLAEMRLSVTAEQSLGGLTDVVTLPSLDHQRKTSDLGISESDGVSSILCTVE